jgi:hypothetical protein
MGQALREYRELHALRRVAREIQLAPVDCNKAATTQLIPAGDFNFEFAAQCAVTTGHAHLERSPTTGLKRVRETDYGADFQRTRCRRRERTQQPHQQAKPGRTHGVVPLFQGRQFGALAAKRP